MADSGPKYGDDEPPVSDVTSNSEAIDDSADHLIPGLPNHLAQLCLSSLSPSLLYRVCATWRHLIYSPDFPPFFSLYAVLWRRPSTLGSDSSFNNLQAGPGEEGGIKFSCFDPLSSRWTPLPDPPSDPPLNTIARRHPSFLSRVLPIQSVSTSGRLVLIAATTRGFEPALHRPLVFDPASKEWRRGPEMSAPRRWCVAGSIGGSVYVASGLGASHRGEVARSLESWDPSGDRWVRRAPFRDGRFSREATEAVGLVGTDKLCMVNVKGKGPKEGAVYDVAMDRWEPMARGMLEGWNGPAAVDEDDGAVYAVDQESGSVVRYDEEGGDRWRVVVEGSESLRGAEHVSVRCGKVCVVVASCKIVVVDVRVRPCRVWTVEPPQGMEAISVHVLPRMSSF